MFYSRLSRRRAEVRLAILLLWASGIACSKPDSEGAPEPAGGAITLWTDSTELFMIELPPIGDP